MAVKEFQEHVLCHPANDWHPEKNMLSQSITYTPRKTNMDIKNCHSWKMMLKSNSSSKPSFLGSMLVFGSFHTYARKLLEAGDEISPLMVPPVPRCGKELNESQVEVRDVQVWSPRLSRNFDAWIWVWFCFGDWLTNWIWSMTIGGETLEISLIFTPNFLGDSGSNLMSLIFQMS